MSSDNLYHHALCTYGTVSKIQRPSLKSFTWYLQVCLIFVILCSRILLYIDILLRYETGGAVQGAWGATAPPKKNWPRMKQTS